MHAMVLYDSLFGNTEQIACAIEGVLKEDGPVALRAVSEVDVLPPDLDLLVIGGPTQGHGVSAPMKTLLDATPPGRIDGVDVATFDTRLKWPEFLSGSAARGIAKHLTHKGARLITPPESFYVEGKEGPLAAGELDRAATWARQVSAILAATP